MVFICTLQRLVQPSGELGTQTERPSKRAFQIRGNRIVPQVARPAKIQQVIKFRNPEVVEDLAFATPVATCVPRCAEVAERSGQPASSPQVTIMQRSAEDALFGDQQNRVL